MVRTGLINVACESAAAQSSCRLSNPPRDETECFIEKHARLSHFRIVDRSFVLSRIHSNGNSCFQSEFATSSKHRHSKLTSSNPGLKARAFVVSASGNGNENDNIVLAVQGSEHQIDDGGDAAEGDVYWVSHGQKLEVLVCTGKSCRKDGSLNTLDLLRELAPPHVDVTSCGCLGRCGNGPNLMLLPRELLCSHCNTPSHAANLLQLQCHGGDGAVNLQALELRNRARQKLADGNPAAALELLSEALNFHPRGGFHHLFADRSAVRLRLGDVAGALADACMAGNIKPGWTTAVIRRAEAHAVAHEYEEALQALQEAADRDAEISKSKQFKRQVKELQRRMLEKGVVS